jgi:hypothetical protein
MDADDDFRRPPPPQPYQPVASQLFVPAEAVRATVELLCRAGVRESGLFWYGRRHADGGGTVYYIAAPQQRMTWGNYSVSAAALAEIVHRLPDDWKPLAQIHSHPGEWVEHSRYDDQVMSSRRALSLVFPFYGRVLQPFPGGIGIHEWQDGHWHLLDTSAAQQRIVLCDGAVKVEDFRWPTLTKSPTVIY